MERTSNKRLHSVRPVFPPSTVEKAVEQCREKVGNGKEIKKKNRFAHLGNSTRKHGQTKKQKYNCSTAAIRKVKFPMMTQLRNRTFTHNATFYFHLPYVARAYTHTAIFRRRLNEKKKIPRTPVTPGSGLEQVGDSS